jgi:hypothetical protein
MQSAYKNVYWQLLMPDSRASLPLNFLHVTNLQQILFFLQVKLPKRLDAVIGNKRKFVVTSPILMKNLHLL